MTLNPALFSPSVSPPAPANRSTAVYSLLTRLPLGETHSNPADIPGLLPWTSPSIPSFQRRALEALRVRWQQGHGAHDSALAFPRQRFLDGAAIRLPFISPL